MSQDTKSHAPSRPATVCAGAERGTPPVSHRIRLQRSYIALACFNILTVLAGLLLTHALSDRYLAAVQTNETWLQRLNSCAQLYQLSRSINMSISSALATRDVPRASAQMSATTHEFQAMLDIIRSERWQADDAGHTQRIESLLSTLASAIRDLDREGRSVLAFLSRSDLERATQQLAVKNEVASRMAGAFEDLRAEIRNIQARTFSTQAASMSSVRRLELAIAAAVLLLVCGVTLHGYQLHRSISSLDGERERLFAMTSLRKAELEALYNASPVGIAFADAMGNCTYLNPVSERILGVRSEEAIGNGWEQAVHPDDRNRVVGKWLSAVREQATFESEHRFVHADGSSVWAAVKASQVRDSKGSMVGYVAAIEDITLRKSGDFALRESEARARQALADLRFQKYALDQHAIVSETDARGRIIYVNDKFCTISGYSREELLGRDHRLVNSGYHPRTFWTEMFATVARGETWRREVRNRTKDGSYYWVDTTNVAVRGLDGKIERYISIRADITDRKRTEEQLQRAKLEADAANLAKSEFLANMSHEIRTPMTAILGFAEMLCNEHTFGLDAEKRHEAATTIARNGTHLLAIINDILDLSKIEAGRMRVECVDVDLATLVQEVRSLMQVRAIEKNLSLDVECVYPLPARVRTDPTRLRQILVNLLGNAIKFTQAGRIVLRCAMRQGGEQPAVQFEVVDSGIGMTDEQMALLFQPFVQADATTSRRFGGTGLGLTISRRLAHMLGGEIAVQSSVGKGSTFVVTIDPGSLEGVEMLHSEERRGESVAVKAAEEAPVELSLSGRRILVVEDGPDNQRLICHYLTRGGADVHVAENGKAAVDAVLEAGAPGGKRFDLILMDMQMPVMDGYQATRLLRRRSYDGPIVALTANAMAEDRQRCLDAGCNDYATKPINRRMLMEMVAVRLGERTIFGTPSNESPAS